MVRPRIFKSAEELQAKIDHYFEVWEEEGDIMPTLSGLAIHLDVDRDTLANYNRREEFFGIINKAKTKCFRYLENNILNKETFCGGQIFIAKNGYGLRDQQDLNHGGQDANPVKVDTEIKANPRAIEILDILKEKIKKNNSDAAKD